MKYILGFGILFKKYKGKTNLRIFSDDRLIDEIVVDRDIKTKAQNNSWRQLFDLDLPEFWGDHTYHDPSKLFVYEIDDSILGDRINFQLHDENSNYTNGFLTKSNLMQFKSTFLIPKHLMDKKILTRIYHMDRKRNESFYKYTDKVMKDPDDAKFEQVETTFMPWPETGKVVITEADGTLVGQAHCWYGGKTEVYVPLVKKFGIHMLYAGRDLTKEPKKMFFECRFLRYIHSFNLLNTIA